MEKSDRSHAQLLHAWVERDGKVEWLTRSIAMQAPPEHQMLVEPAAFEALDRLNNMTQKLIGTCFVLALCVLLCFFEVFRLSAPDLALLNLFWIGLFTVLFYDMRRYLNVIRKFFASQK
jgi:hypothetical protein